MTPCATRGYGSRPPVTRRSLLATLALAAAACGPANVRPPSPTDALYWPIGVATVPATGAPGGTAVLVSSTNFDLTYDTHSGASVASLDPARAAGPGLLPAAALLGRVAAPSFGGPLAIAEPDACGLPGRLALLASREEDALLRISVDPAGGLSCGDGCMSPLDPGRSNPFGVTVACRKGTDGTVTRSDAFVTYLRPTAQVPEISRVDLATGTPHPIALEAATGCHAYASAYDPARDRLWVTGQVGGDAPIWAVDLATPCDPTIQTCPVVTRIDLYPVVRGIEPRGIALSTPDTVDPATGQPFTQRVYVAARVYDPDLAATILDRPGYDVGAKLVVLEVSEGQGGTPTVRVVRLVNLPLGADEVKVLPARPGKRDLVVVSCSTDSSVVVYDDDLGATVATFGASGGAATDTSHMPLGAPRTGRQPVGLAVEARTETVNGTARPVDYVYVTAFLSDIVQVIRIDPEDPAHADFVETIGEIRPWP